MNTKLAHFGLGFLITLIVSMFYAHQLRRDFDQQVLDFADGRGCWIAPDAMTGKAWPPHFHFQYFKDIPAPKPTPKPVTESYRI